MASLDELAGILQELAGFGKEVVTKTGENARHMSQIVDKMSRGEATPSERKEVIGQAIQEMGALPMQIVPAVWKAMDPAAKATATMMFNEFPEVMQQVMKSSRSFDVKPSLDLPAEVFGTFNPKTDVISLNINRGVGDVPTLLHETQHFFNPERIAKTNPEDASTIALLLRDFLPAKNIGTLDRDLGYLSGVGGLPNLSGSLRPEHITPSRLLSKLDLYKTGSPLGSELVPSQYGTGAATRAANLSRASMDEALAYTAENAAAKNASPLLKQLAEALGLLGK